eukprot:493754-Rhodomonas_salina.2
MPRDRGNETQHPGTVRWEKGPQLTLMVVTSVVTSYRHLQEVSSWHLQEVSSSPPMICHVAQATLTCASLADGPALTERSLRTQHQSSMLQSPRSIDRSSGSLLLSPASPTTATNAFRVISWPNGPESGGSGPEDTVATPNAARGPGLACTLQPCLLSILTHWD